MRIQFERAAQAALRVAALPRRLLGKGQVDHRVGTARIDLERDPRFRRGGIESAEAEVRRREVHVRADVLRIDGDDALELARRLVEQPLAEIEMAQVVVRLDVHLVALQRGAVVDERLLEVAGSLVVEPELELVGRRLVRRSLGGGGRREGRGGRRDGRGARSEE